MEQLAAVTRHCAYCLKLGGFQLCGGCRKRAYCSRECQTRDWSRRGDGQRHVNWCKRHAECGEEDVDWQVVPIPNKGLGIRAMQLLPAGMKIIVEPVFTSLHGHPGIQDLEPVGQSTERKFLLNSFRGSNAVSGELLAVRNARVNHSCQPNTAAIYDETAHVAILYSQRDILPGEEISICYYPTFYSRPPSEDRIRRFGPPTWNIEEELTREKSLILNFHGITCTPDCSCNDPIISNLVRESRQIYHCTLLNFTNSNQIEGALAAGERLLDIHRRLNISWVDRANVQYVLFQIAITKYEYLPRAMVYMRSSLEFYRKMCPYSEANTKKFERFLEHPSTHSQYLMVDRAIAASEI